MVQISRGAIRTFIQIAGIFFLAWGCSLLLMAARSIPEVRTQALNKGIIPLAVGVILIIAWVFLKKGGGEEYE